MTNKIGQVEWELENIEGLPARVLSLLTAAGDAVPDASTTVEGKVELATNAEAIAGVDTVRAVTPAGLAAVLGNRGVGGVEFTVGASDTGTVAIQLVDHNGADLTEPAVLMAYLADAADGLEPAGADPSGGTAIGTDGFLISGSVPVVFWLISEVDGDIDLVLTEAGAATWYLVIVLPNGTLAISGAIVFTV